MKRRADMKKPQPSGKRRGKRIQVWVKVLVKLTQFLKIKIEVGIVKPQKW